MSMPISFVGPVSVEHAGPPMSLRLRGRDAGAPQCFVLLSFAAAQAPPGLPATFVDLEVEPLSDRPGIFLLRSGASRYELRARSLHLHRDWREPVAALLPPQPVRLRTRLLWRLGMLLAAMPVTRRLLAGRKE